eukprot:1131340-Amphidinium_carterae.1
MFGHRLLRSLAWHFCAVEIRQKERTELNSKNRHRSLSRKQSNPHRKLEPSCDFDEQFNCRWGTKNLLAKINVLPPVDCCPTNGELINSG